MASGGHDIGNVDHSPENMAHILYGGMVGGPSKDDSFADKRSNYKQSEASWIRLCNRADADISYSVHSTTMRH